MNQPSLVQNDVRVEQSERKTGLSAEANREPAILKVGVVGCGRVAEYHMRFIKETKNCSLVGLADQNLEAARRLGAKWDVRNIYGSLEELLDSNSLDVLHIATPPPSHYTQAMAAIDRGVHVFVEKPVTLASNEATALYERAAEQNLLVCPDFTQIFHPSFQQAASVIASSRLGRVINVESHLSDSFNMAELREVVGIPWSYQLPGGVLQNYITHPLYLALYWTGLPKKITVSGRSFGTLPQGLTDHLDIMLECERSTAHVVLSSAIKSQPYFYVNVFCEKGVVSVNFDTSTMLVTEDSSLPRTVDRGTANFRQAYRLFREGAKNIIAFLRGKLVPYQGLQILLPRFYESIRNSTEPPVPAALAKAVVQAEEAIFAQLKKLHLDTRNRPSRQPGVKQAEKLLVSGATGYVGSEVVRELVKEGYYVRALVRPLAHTDALERLGVELFYGDVRDRESLTKATESMNIIVHLAAGVRGSSGFMLDSCIEGTKNVAEAARNAGIQRVIYMSSMSVYDYAKLRNGDAMNEKSPLEEQPESRGTYSWAKRSAEDLALHHLTDDSPAWTILRPSVVVGKGSNIFSPAGIKLGNFLICLSPGSKNLRLVHVEDVAMAIVRLIRNERTRGQIFVLSSPETITLRDYVNKYVRQGPHGNIRPLYLPYWFMLAAMWSLKALRGLLGKGPSISMRTLAYLYRDVRVDSSALQHQTGWQPRIGLLDRLFAEAKDSPV